MEDSMKHRLAVFGIVLLSAVATGAQTLPAAPATALDQVPAPLEAVTCGPLLQTAVHTVGGSTCAQATSDLHGVLTGAAGCGCGFCSQQFIDQACMVIQGGRSVSGYLKYRCKICPIEDSVTPSAPVEP
jgi:hypothetical protein